MSTSKLHISRIEGLIRQAGAVAHGVAPLEQVEEREFARYERWLAENRHGDMAYLAKNLEIRRNPALLLDGNPVDNNIPLPNHSEPPEPSGGSILSFAFPYFAEDPYRSGRVRFARYALGDDYHEVLRQRLQPVADAIREMTGCATRICIDSAPILERYWAVRAGLGYIGRNRQLIIPRIGSHIFLAEIVTHAEILQDKIPANSPHHCLDCGKCIAACPGGALASVDFNACNCFSYLTIEHLRSQSSSAPDPSTLSANRRFFYGCDICLEVCPLAKPEAAIAPLPEFQPRTELLELTVDRAKTLTQEEFSLIFRRSPVKRIKLAGLRLLANM